MDILMIHGLPLAGKSTAAAKIKEALEKKGIKAEIIKSVATRYGKGDKVLKNPEELIDERIEKTRREKDDSYRAMCKLAARSISAGYIPILDATFHNRKRREWVYELCRKEKSGLIILWVEFDDEKEIKSMLDERKKDHNIWDNILCEWKQYSIMNTQFEPLDETELKSRRIIRFDRKNNAVKLYNCNNKESMINISCEAVKSEK